jgi:septal ring factor EnvC (AmiA/AmiB activator)
LLLLLVYFGGLLPLPNAQALETGFIRVMDLTMRSGPGKNTRPIKTLERGALVSILENRDRWLKVLHEGHTGYILNDADYVRLLGVADRGMQNPAASARERGAHANHVREETARQDIAGEIRQSTEELAALKNRETTLVDAVDQVERKVNRKRRQIMATETDLGELEKRILMEKVQLAELEARVGANLEYAGQRLRALYQLSSLGTLPMLANAESWVDFLKRKTALTKVLAADRRLLDKLVTDQRRQADLLAGIQGRRDERRRLEETLSQELDELTRSLTERKAMLAEIKSKAALQNDLIEGLKVSAKALDTAITGLTDPKLAGPAPAPDGAISNAAAPSIDGVSVGGEAVDGGRALTAVTPSPATAAPVVNPLVAPRPFEKLKGLLNFPVSGKIISSYGHYRNLEFNVMNFRSGVLIRADRGEPIHAVANGTTLFADWFKGYGNMVIIDHGDHYYTVYAHLEALFKSSGDLVDADEVIATVGDTATLAGPGLHFEVRHHGKPIDPLPWLRDTDRAASDRKKGVDG